MFRDRPKRVPFNRTALGFDSLETEMNELLQWQRAECTVSSRLNVLRNGRLELRRATAITERQMGLKETSSASNFCSFPFRCMREE